MIVWEVVGRSVLKGDPDEILRCRLPRDCGIDPAARLIEVEQVKDGIRSVWRAVKGGAIRADYGTRTPPRDSVSATYQAAGDGSVFTSQFEVRP